jgi:hypothetical protein
MSAFIWSMYYVKESNALLLNSNTNKRPRSRFVAKIFWDAYKRELSVAAFGPKVDSHLATL